MKDESGSSMAFALKNDIAFWRRQVDRDAAQLENSAGTGEKLECWMTGIRLNGMKLYPNLIWANPVREGNETAPIEPKSQ